MPLLGIQGQVEPFGVLGGPEVAASNSVFEAEACFELVVTTCEAENMIVVVCVAWSGTLCLSSRTSRGSWPGEVIEVLYGTTRCPVEVSPGRGVCRY
jgi:hypothetical protein